MRDARLAYKAVELQHHAGMPFDFAWHVNLCDVAVHSGVFVIGLVDDSRTERVTHLRVGGSERVIEANS